jgi:predicted DNA-binding transcriptional regulator AlpA
MSNERLMDLAGMADMLGVSESTARRLSNEAGFPARYRLAARCVRWRVSDVEQWLSGRAEVPVNIPAYVTPELLVSRPRGPRRKVAA